MTMFQDEELSWSKETQGQSLRNHAVGVLNTQYIRELTENSREAILKYMSDNPNEVDFEGHIYWDVEDVRGVPKRTIYDNGHGLAQLVMENAYKTLGQSGEEKQSGKNYGIGGRISTVTQNPYGVVVKSWPKDSDVGYSLMVHLNKHNDKYVIKAEEGVNNTRVLSFPISKDSMPEKIRKYGHGHQVILLGSTANEDTTLPPTDAKYKSADGWILRTLNERYWKFENKIKVHQVQRKLETFKSQSETLDSITLKRDTVMLKDGLVDVRILDKKLSSKYNNRELRTGFTALEYEGELFDLCAGNAHKGELFGVGTAKKQVVLIIHPFLNSGYEQDLKRSAVYHNNEPVNWERWGEEFRKNKPEFLKTFLDNQATKSNEQNKRAISSILVKYKDMFQGLPKYVPSKTGPYNMDEDSLVNTRISAIHGQGSQRKTTASAGSLKGLLGDTVVTTGGVKANLSSAFQPEFIWLKDEDDLQDRAAKYVRVENAIYANPKYMYWDFIVEKIQKTIPEFVNIEEMKKTFFLVVEFHLSQKVAGTLALEKRASWSTEAINEALSVDALTNYIHSSVIDIMERTIKFLNSNKFTDAPTRGVTNTVAEFKAVT
jgi:hypothetical protein